MTIRKKKGTVTPEPIINQKGHCSLQLPNVIALGVKPLGRSPKAGKTSRFLSLSPRCQESSQRTVEDDVWCPDPKLPLLQQVQSSKDSEIQCSFFNCCIYNSQFLIKIAISDMSRWCLLYIAHSFNIIYWIQGGTSPKIHQVTALPRPLEPTAMASSNGKISTFASSVVFTCAARILELGITWWFRRPNSGEAPDAGTAKKETKIPLDHRDLTWFHVISCDLMGLKWLNHQTLAFGLWMINDWDHTGPVAVMELRLCLITRGQIWMVLSPGQRVHLRLGFWFTCTSGSLATRRVHLRLGFWFTCTSDSGSMLCIQGGMGGVRWSKNVHVTSRSSQVEDSWTLCSAFRGGWVGWGEAITFMSRPVHLKFQTPGLCTLHSRGDGWGGVGQ